MKSVIVSIQPQWCELIASGKKTIEVRKSAPKEVPFKVYIYQTKKRWIYKLLPWLKERQAKVIGEFVCDKVDRFDSKWSEWAYSVAPIDIPCTMPISEEKAIKLCKEQAFLANEDIVAYFGDEDWKAAFWHISDLKIYDEPKELGEFKNSKNLLIKKPFQSWGYCYENDN